MHDQAHTDAQFSKSDLLILILTGLFFILQTLRHKGKKSYHIP